MSIKYYLNYAPTLLARFESKRQLKLPQDYCEFLRDFNGGEYLGCRTVWVPALKEPVSIGCLFGLHPGDEDKDLFYHQSYEDHDLYKDEVFIGIEGCGNFFILNCSDFAGGVYYYDRGAEHAMSNGRTLYLVAFCFSDFLNGLRETKNEIYTWAQPLQWPEPVSKTNPKRWPPRKPAIWKPGEGHDTVVNSASE